MPGRNTDNPERIHLARRPIHISDETADKTVRALNGIAHGDRLGRRSRSLISSGEDAARITELLTLDRARVSPDDGQPADAARHSGDGTEPTEDGAPLHPALGGPYHRELAAQDKYRDELQPPPPPAVVRERLRRSKLLPHFLAVPCPEHHAAAGEPCFRTAQGVCGDRVWVSFS